MKPVLQKPSAMWLKCQFSGEACSTESTHYRKVISHIFGRNKKCTIGIPDYVWIYYCRKHYQRARYRTGEWPFRQCDLAVDTIQNMRAWGGVESFNLQLRRRETKRTREGTGTDADGSRDTAEPSSAQELDVDQGSPSAPGGFTAINSSNTILQATVKLEHLDSAADSTDEETPQLPPTPLHSEPGKKRSPTIVARPVPDWLQGQVGNNKTFGEILQVLGELRLYLLQATRQGKRAHFPDIEILPNLRRRVGIAASAGKGRISRVTERGKVGKIVKK